MTDNKLTFLLKTGFNQPGITRGALMFSAISATMDVDTVLYCVQEGADIMVAGAVENEKVKKGIPTLKQRLQEAIEAGVDIQICSATAELKGIKEGDLVKPARITGAATLIDLALDSDNVICWG
jgi:predicted peroxiredoxin|tara:strand:+ start:1294 stop:1665 length:372 start_codon:yes stop_codon:yes gene_type:complete